MTGFAFKMLKRETLCHEMYFYDAFCRPFSLTLNEYILQLSQPKYYQFVAITIVLLFAFDPVDFRAVMTPLEVISIWLVGIFVFSMITCIVFLTFAWFTINVVRIRIFSWMITLSGFYVARVVGDLMANAFSDAAYIPAGNIELTFISLAVVMIETIFFRWVMPHQTAQLVPFVQAAAADMSGERENISETLLIGPRTVRLEVLNYLTSEEHYVRVVMRHETFVHRAKLADLVAQTSRCHGFQPHRSWWISGNAMPRIDRSGAKPTLVLADGVIAPIARGRVKATQDWIDAHANWDIAET